MPETPPPPTPTAAPGAQEGETLRKLAIEACRVGGAVLLEWRSKFTTREKGPADLVTDADLASQRAIRELLLQARPGDAFLGEESTPEERAAQRDQEGICWVVDPLDGTVNYVHGFPCWATSVAVVRGDRLIAGAIFDPLRDEVFSASAGGGAWLRGAKGSEEPVRVSEATSVGDALVAVSLPPRVDPQSPDLAGFVAVVQACRAVRRTGSAALNLAYVAAGRLDAHWAHVIQPWDAAAGVLIAAEAGAVVTASDGMPFDVWQADYLVAASKPLHEDLLTRMRPR